MLEVKPILFQQRACGRTHIYPHSNNFLYQIKAQQVEELRCRLFVIAYSRSLKSSRFVHHLPRFFPTNHQCCYN